MAKKPSIPLNIPAGEKVRTESLPNTEINGRIKKAEEQLKKIEDLANKETYPQTKKKILARKEYWELAIRYYQTIIAGQKNTEALIPEDTYENTD